MRSMTGFGQGSAEGAQCRVTVTLRAVNHRYLDVVIRARDEASVAERPLRDLLTGRLERGRVEAGVEVEFLGERPTEIVVDRALLGGLRATVDELAGQDLIARDLTLADLLRVPDAIRLDASGAAWGDDEIALVLDAGVRALDELIEARAAEGASLHAALLERIEGLEAVHGQMVERAAGLPEQMAASLRERIAKLLDDVEPDPQRLAQEVAVLVDRADIAEELDRLASHLEHFRDLAERSGSLGKRLDFLGQEIFRELNTLGAKCRDAELVRHVLDGKVLCEQIREQVQNVE
ncbi:MAG: YicC/YloC family endoribonuclease [Acidobacteriota bacterium]